MMSRPDAQKLVCLVEPDPIALQGLTILLQEQHIDCRGYGDPTLFLGELSDLEPDLVLAEWELRDMEGEALCRQIAEARPDLPVLFLSESLDSDNRLKALAAGALDFMGKPYDRHMLLAKVSAVLRLTMRRSAAGDRDPDTRQDSDGDLVGGLRNLGMTQIKPVPDPESGYGFSYPDVLKWQADLSDPVEQSAALEELAGAGHLDREVQDMIRSCSHCDGIKLNFREVCPHCGTAVVTPGNGGGKHCHKCHGAINAARMSALCLDCSAELDEGEIKTKPVYTYTIRPAACAGPQDVARPSVLAQIVTDQGLTLFSSDLLGEFLRLEERQHLAAARTFAILQLHFRKSALSDQDKAAAGLDHVVLVLKKYLRSSDTLFQHDEDQLLIFLSYIDIKQAQERAIRLRDILDKLGLASLVEVNLSTFDPARIREKAASENG